MTLVQHASNQAVFSSGTTGSVTVTLGSAAGAGSALVACIGITSASAAPTVANVKTGANAENWAKGVGASDATFGIDSEIWVDPNTAGGGTTVVVTVNFGQTATATKQTVVQVDVFEESNILSASAVDKISASPLGNDTASWSSGATATTTQASEIAYGHAVVVPDSAGTGTVTPPGSPWSNQTTLHTTGSVGGFGAFNMYSQAGRQALSSTSTVTYNGTASANSFWEATVLTLKTSGGGGGETSTGSFGLKKASFGGTANRRISSTGSYGLKRIGYSGQIHRLVTTAGSLSLRKASYHGSATEAVPSAGNYGLKKASFGGTGAVTRTITSTGSFGLKKASYHATGLRTPAAQANFALRPVAFSGTVHRVETSTGTYGLQKVKFGGNVHVARRDTRQAQHLSGTVTHALVLGGTASVVDHLLGGTAVTAEPYSGIAVRVDPVNATLVEWTMQEVDIVLAEFNDETVNLTVVTGTPPDTSPYNLTGQNLRMYLKPQAGVPDDNPGVVELSTLTGEITVTDAPNGLATAAIDHTVLTSPTAFTFYRVDVVDPANHQNTAIFGKVSITSL